MINFVYLAGAMSGLSFAEANDWRKEARNLAPYWVQTISPFRGKPYLNDSVCLNDHDDSQVLCTEKAINSRDYNDVKRSSVVLVNLLGTTKVSIGTVMEIAWAKALDIPCVLIIEKGNIHQHAMINASCGFICSTLQEGMDTVATITGDDQQVETYLKDQEKYAQPVVVKSQPISMEEKDLIDGFFNKKFRQGVQPIYGFIPSAEEGDAQLGEKLEQSMLPDPANFIAHWKDPRRMETFDPSFNNHYVCGIDPVNLTGPTRVQTRFPTDNVSTSSIDYNAFLNNPIYNTNRGYDADADNSYAKMISDSIDRIREKAVAKKALDKQVADLQLAEMLKQRNIDINIKAPAPKEDNAGTLSDLLQWLYIPGKSSK